MLSFVHPNPCHPPGGFVQKRPHLSIQNRGPCGLPALPKRLSLEVATSGCKCQPFAPLLRRRRVEPVARYVQKSPFCLLGGMDKSEGDNEGSSWNFKKAMGSLRGKSIEEVLREQIEKQEYYEGGSGKNPPRGGGDGDGGRGGGDGSGGSEDEGIADILDEILQVYVYIISGEELTRLAKDYIKYLFVGNQSVRLKRAMYKWKRFFQRLNQREEIDRFWLEREIINTVTWFDSPEKYRRIMRSQLAARGDEY